MKPSSTGPKPVVIFGVGEVADTIRYYIGQERVVVAFTVDKEYGAESTHLHLPVVDFDEVARTFPPEQYDMYVAMSFRGINAPRAAKVVEARSKGYDLVGYLDREVHVWRDTGFELKPNTCIMEQNVIQPFVTIGENVIMWSGNHVGHNTIIGDHCFIASHAVISGHVRIGDFTFIGVNATIRDNVTIGKRCVIGAGALVLHDVPDDSICFGHETLPNMRVR